MELNLKNIIFSKIEKKNCHVQGIVLNSVIKEEISIPNDSIIEYSIFDVKVFREQIGKNVFLHFYRRPLGQRLF